ncbi:hypothetical protein H6758_03790 [Candidatus Nomurabacteria bacterium]|nr:hypothetical protein [Candidatus Nomurabacteria bacterium]
MGTIVVVTLVLFGIFAMAENVVGAAPPAIITYQGKLLKSGAAVTTTQQMGFMVYSASTGGSLLYTASGTPTVTSTINVPVSQGIFSVSLGNTGTNSIPASIFATNTALYLQVWVNDGGTYTKLTPRKRLTASPFAMNSQYLLGYSPAVSSTSQYIPVSDSNGNFAFRGDPQSTGVAGGTLYINPGTAGANETLFGIALNGSERFRVDEDGDTWIEGGLVVSTTLQAATTTLAELSVTNGITLGGVRRTTWPSGGGGGSSLWASSTGRVYPATLTDVVLVGKNSTSSASTVFEVSGSSLFEGNVSLSSGSTLTLAGSLTQTGISSFATTTFNGDLSVLSDLNVGSGKLVYVTSTGFVGVNTSTPGAQFAVDGNGYFKGTYDITADLRILDNLYVGSRSEAITSSTFALDGDDAYIHDLLGVGDSIFVENALHIGTSSLHLTGNTGGAGGLIRMDGGPLVIDSAGALSLNTNKNQQIYTGSGNFGINTTSPAYNLSVEGQAYVSATATAKDLVVSDSLTLGGVRRTSWPGGVETTTNNDFSGLNTFSATTTFTSTTFSGKATINNLLNVTGKTFNPRPAGSYTNTTLFDDVDKIVVKNNIAYIGSATGTLSLVDVSNPNSPALLGSYTSTTLAPFGGEMNLQVGGQYAYFGSSNAFHIIDISKPKSPTFVGQILNFGFPTGLSGSTALSGSVLYGANGVGGAMPEYIDITRAHEPRKYSPAGASSLDQGRATFVSGRYVYVLGSTPNLVIFDYSDKTHPVQVGIATSTSFSNISFTAENGDLFVDGRYAYVTAPTSGFGGGGDALTIVDVGNPASPSVVATLPSTTSALMDDPTSVVAVGDLVYITSESQNSLAIVDVSTKASPTVVGSITDSGATLLRGAKSVDVSGNYAYVVSRTDKSLQVIDISGIKVNNAQIGSARIERIQVSGKSYFDEDIDIGGGLSVGANGLLLRGDLNIIGNGSISTSTISTGTIRFAGAANFRSDITSGSAAFTFNPGANLDTAVFRILNSSGSELFYMTKDGYLGIGTSTPSKKLEVSGDAYVKDNLYVGRGTEAITSSTFALDGDDAYIHDLLGVGDSIFVENALHIGTSSLHLTGDTGATTGGLIRMDGAGLTIDAEGTLSLNTQSGNGISFGGNVTSDLSVRGKVGSPVNVGTIDLSFGNTVEVVDGYAYVTLIDGGFSIIDVGNPATPTTTATIDPVSNSYDISVSGNYAFVSHNNGGSDGISVIDITDKSNPFSVKNYRFSALAVESVISGNYLYVAASTQLSVIDISNPLEPVTVGSWSGDSVVGIEVQGSYVYVNGGTEIHVIDVSEPTSPVQVATFNTAQSINDMILEDGYIYTSGGSPEGVRIFRVGDNGNIRLIGSLTSGLTDLRKMAISGDYLYASDFTDGLVVIDISDKTAPVEVVTTNPGSSGALDVEAVGNYVYLATKADGFRILDVTAIRSANAHIGSLRTGRLYVDNQAFFSQPVHINSGLHVGNDGLMLSGDFAMFSNSTSTSATTTMRFGDTVRFLSTVTSSDDYAFIFDTQNRLTINTTTYIMSIRNNGDPLFSIDTRGDVYASGTYHGEAINVSTSGQPGDLAEKVDIAINESVEPGDVIVVDHEANDRYRKSVQPYQTGVAGVIATNPTIVIGSGKTENQAKLTMVGRVPVKVSDENGAIQRGDLLVTGSKPGYAMRFDPYHDTGAQAVGVVGVALEPLPVNEGKVMALIRGGYINNRTKTLSEIQQDLLSLAQYEGIPIGTSVQDLSININSEGGIDNQLVNQDLGGSYIINVAGLLGKDGAWEVDDNGRFITKVATSAGTKELYAIQSGNTEYVFSGTGQLESGSARVDFGEVTQELIDGNKPMKVSVTLTSEANGIFVESKNATGFTVKELQNGSSSATFDWVVIAQRKVIDSDNTHSDEGVQEAQQERLEEQPEEQPEEQQPEVVEEEVGESEENEIVEDPNPLTDESPEQDLEEVPPEEVQEDSELAEDADPVSDEPTGSQESESEGASEEEVSIDEASPQEETVPEVAAEPEPDPVVEEVIDPDPEPVPEEVVDQPSESTEEN